MRNVQKTFRDNSRQMFRSFIEVSRKHLLELFALRRQGGSSKEADSCSVNPSAANKEAGMKLTPQGFDPVPSTWMCTRPVIPLTCDDEDMGMMVRR
jgi:hypothetical protein